METPVQNQHRGPHLGMLALIFTTLFITGLSFVVSFDLHSPHFPGPYDPAASITSYFQENPHAILLCAFFQFCAAIPLGLFTVATYSRLRFLGVKAAGPGIGLFGGLATAVSVMTSSLILWALAFPGVSQDAAVLRALYYVSFGIGGVGYSVPMGLLIAGISITSYFMKILPKWLVWSGIVIAIIGELSCLNLVFPALLPLIPLTRFPGFIWLAIAGFRLPKFSLNR